MSLELDVSGFSDSQRVNFARTLLESPRVSIKGNLDIIASTPLAEKYPQNVAIQKLLTISEANKALPEIRSCALEVISSALYLDNPEPQTFELLINSIERTTNPQEAKTKTLYIFEILLKSSGSDTFGYQEKPFQIAISHLAVLLSANFYKSAQDENDRKTWLSFVHYFTALENLYTGVKTNSNLFANHPEQCDLNLLDEILTLVSVSDMEEIKRIWLRNLFDGKSVSAVKPLGDEEGFFVMRENSV